MANTLRHNRDYWWMWSGQAISLLGDEVFVMTITLWLALVLLGGDALAPLAVAVVLVAETAPVVLLSLIGGVFADRWNRRRIMLITDAARAILIGCQTVLVIAAPVLPRSVLFTLTCVITALVGTATQFFNPARFGILAVVVDDADRERVASIATATAALAGIIGPSLGAVLFVAAGAQWAMALNAVSFVASFVAVAMVRTGRGRTSTGERAAERSTLRRDLREGLRYFAGNRTLKVVLVTSGAVAVAVSCLGPLEVFFVIQNLNGSPGVYGVLATVASVGALVGAVITAVFAKRLRAAAVYAYGLVAVGALLAAYSRMTTPLGAIIVMFIIGIPLAAVNSMVGPLLIRSTPEHLLGRVSTILQPVTEVASMASMTLAAWLASTVLRDMDVTISGVHFGAIDTMFLTAGILVVVAGLGAARALRVRSETAAGPRR